MLDELIIKEKLLSKDLLNHCNSVRSLCDRLYTGPGKNALLRAAEIHDIGKFYISDDVLCSDHSLTLTERMCIDMYPLYGYWDAKANGEDEIVCQLILLHHGISKVSQPRLIAGNMAKVVRLFPYLMAADIYSAVREDRSYHSSRTHSEAISIVRVVPDIPDNIKTMLEELE